MGSSGERTNIRGVSAKCVLSRNDINFPKNTNARAACVSVKKKGATGGAGGGRGKYHYYAIFICRSKITVPHWRPLCAKIRINMGRMMHIRCTPNERYGDFEESDSSLSRFQRLPLRFVYRIHTEGHIRPSYSS